MNVLSHRSSLARGSGAEDARTPKRFATARRLRTARSIWSASDLSALFVRRGTARGSWSPCMRNIQPPTSNLQPPTSNIKPPGCALLWDTARCRKTVYGHNPRAKSHRGYAWVCCVHFGAISGTPWTLFGTGPIGSEVRSAQLLSFLLRLSMASRLLIPKVRLQKAFREQIK